MKMRIAIEPLKTATICLWHALVVACTAIAHALGRSLAWAACAAHLRVACVVRAARAHVANAESLAVRLHDSNRLALPPEAPSRRFRKHGPSSGTPPQRPPPWSKAGVLAGFTGVAIAVAAFVLYGSASAALDPSLRLADPQQHGVQINDRNGSLIFEFPGSRGFQRPVALEDISPYLVDATIATEDASFWENPGVNMKGLLRALHENLAFWESGGFFRGSGGSSITQQLVKNLYIAPDRRDDRDLLRKAWEIFLAFELNRRYSKEKILESYLNVVYYGNSAYGAAAAAERYFDKSADKLSLAEAALLAGIPNAPSYYDPFPNPEAARDRQRVVLDAMARQGYITPEQAEAAATETLSFQSRRYQIRAPHFLFYVRELLPRLVGEGAARGGLKVTTTIDVNLQAQAEEILRSHVARLRAAVGAGNAALVAIEPESGKILAMAGSAGFWDEAIQGQVNNATALRQPGSTMKPFAYLAAFLKGWSPATIVDDAPLVLANNGNPFVLSNADGRYRGRISAREALGNSLNAPAIRALEFAGLRDVHALARRMGLSTLGDQNQYGPSLALGGADVSLLDLTYAYSVLANGGVQGGMSSVIGTPRRGRPFDPIPVLEVQDLRGKTLWRAEPRSERIVPAPQVFQVTSILSDNEARAQMFGRSSPLDLGSRPAAVKTGLADDGRHAWTFGYTPQLAVGVWVGNTDNRPMPGALSSQTAAPIWHDFMLTALAPLPVVPFSPPPDVALVQICRDTGLPPTRGCRRVVTEVFVEGAVPQPAPAPQPQTPERTVSPPPPGRAPQVQPPPQPAPEVRRDDRRGGRRGRR